MEESVKRWIEISVEADPQSVDDLLGLFEKHCVGGAVLENVHEGRLGDPNERINIKGFLDEGDGNTLQKLEIALLLLHRVSPISEPQIRVLSPEDWAETWKDGFAPRYIAEHLVVVPSWHSYEPGPEDRPLYLDPGMAFGTGLHASTRLAAQGLERVIESGWRVLDVGTGSGILAIAAVLCGAESVDAIDIAFEAVRAAKENVAKNDMADTIHVAQATLPGGGRKDRVPEWEADGYDLALMNILAEPIADMAPAVANALSSRGWLVASGIIEERGDMVRAKLKQAHLFCRETLSEEGWIALLARKE